MRITRAGSSLRHSVQDNPNATGKPNFTVSTSFVRAAQVLNVDSTTGVIDVSMLRQMSASSAVQKVSEKNVRIYCNVSILLIREI